jgi:hypothetical protein
MNVAILLGLSLGNVYPFRLLASLPHPHPQPYPRRQRQPRPNQCQPFLFNFLRCAFLFFRSRFAELPRRVLLSDFPSHPLLSAFAASGPDIPLMVRIRCALVCVALPRTRPVVNKTILCSHALEAVANEPNYFRPLLFKLARIYLRLASSYVFTSQSLSMVGRCVESNCSTDLIVFQSTCRHSLQFHEIYNSTLRSLGSRFSFN